MPFVDIALPTGAFSIQYAIATPTSGSESANTIEPGLPCIIFIHSGYLAKEAFELQFSDGRLREFNLITFDMRGFGETTGHIGDNLYTPTESAYDVEQIMLKLDLPPSHFFGVSNGCTVALEFTARRPDLVLTLCLCSPLSPVELVDVARGRLEVHEYWTKLCEVIDGNGYNSPECHEFTTDILIGATQLLFNNAKSNCLDSMGAFAIVKSKEIWSSSVERRLQGYKTGVEWFLERKPLDDDALQKIKVPTKIIHCREDVAYSLDCAETLMRSLQNAGNSQVSLHEVPGAHYGNITNPEPINLILYKAVSAYHPELLPSMNRLSCDDEDYKRMLTPFTQTLIQYGYDLEDGSVI